MNVLSDSYSLKEWEERVRLTSSFFRKECKALGDWGVLKNMFIVLWIIKSWVGY